MSLSLEARFERYCDRMVETLMHADREVPARWYIKGLMLPGERKSIEPMAARVQPDNVRSAHQSMHHLVAEAAWSDAAMLVAVAEAVLPKLVSDDAPVHWIIDDTGFPKKGTHSVGVAHSTAGRVARRTTAGWRSHCRSPQRRVACRWIIVCTCRASGATIWRAARRPGSRR